MATLRKAVRIILALCFVVLAPLGIRSCLEHEGSWVTVRITTAAGEIQVRVYPEKAPLTVANFLRYAEAGRYNGTTFFRVVTRDNQPNDKIKIAVIQGGDVAEEKCFPAIAHETTRMTRLKHGYGTISMARDKPGTATSSFFICIGPQPELDFGGRRNPDGQGFAAFGRVVRGMDVVRRIHGMDQDRQMLKKPVAITSLIRLAKPSQVGGIYGAGYKGTPGDIHEAIRHAIRRMTFAHGAALLLFLALAGWLAWRGALTGWSLRRESPSWEGSSWAQGRNQPQCLPLWPRLLGLALFLLLLALLALMLIGM